MKKFLIIGALILTVATSMVAGTLATYTKSVDFSGSVTAKRFAFTAAGSVDDSINVKLAPSETDSWKFVVSNKENSAISEVSMDVTISVTLPDGWAALGVKPSLEFDGQSAALTNSGNTYTMKVANVLPANTEKTATGILSFTWENDTPNKDADHTQAGTTQKTGTISVKITGTQHISA